MIYTWVSQGAQYKPKENKTNPWAVDYMNSNLYIGVMYFKTLDDALSWISTVEVSPEYPF